MFEGNVSDWDILRLEFVSWCRWYNSIYSLPPGERPSLGIIDDNVELDRWTKEREMEAEKHHRDLQKSLKDKGGSGSRGHNVSFNMADYED